MSSMCLVCTVLLILYKCFCCTHYLVIFRFICLFFFCVLIYSHELIAWAHLSCDTPDIGLGTAGTIIPYSYFELYSRGISLVCSIEVGVSRYGL